MKSQKTGMTMAEAIKWNKENKKRLDAEKKAKVEVLKKKMAAR